MATMRDLRTFRVRVYAAGMALLAVSVTASSPVLAGGVFSRNNASGAAPARVQFSNNQVRTFRRDDPPNALWGNPRRQAVIHSVIPPRSSSLRPNPGN
jgi:hypothetical protein